MKNLCDISRFLLAGLFFFTLANHLELLQIGSNVNSLNLTGLTLIAWLLIERSDALFKKISIPPTNWISWMAITALVYINAMGSIFGLYGEYFWYDKMAHLVGGAAVASFSFPVIWYFYRSRKIKLGILETGFISIATTTFLGVILEIGECLQDSFFGSSQLGNGVDTVDDMACNIIGALLALIFTGYYYYKKKGGKL